MNTKVEQTEKSEVAVREEAVLSFWREHDTFKKSIETPAGNEPVGDFVFYDGPPFATGLPHYGHLLAGTIKDAVPRFWTMNGYRVRRKWGWDCHGLPLENLIEKKLGLATKRDIEEYGIQNFNEQARDAVLEFADDWRRIVPQMGRFVDMDDDYKTMDSNYTESVWWVFSELYKKGLVYEGFKTMHLCPRCGTTLSNFEVNQGYKDTKDIAITVKLPLVDDPDSAALLVWTTTPWTMPGNLAAAVHRDYVYARVRVTTEEGSEVVIVAKERLAQLEGVDHKVVGEMSGADLVGQRYEPPFPWLQEQEFTGKENAWHILHADYVELGEEGTGAVHLAPAFGEDDMILAQEHGVPIVHHVDESGHFKEFVVDFAGQLVKPKDDDEAGITHLDADIEIVKALKANGRLLKKENITHSYPHCWRCDTPLLNYATTSWFVEVTKIRDELVAENNKVHWVPEHVGKARFGKWLEGARDWAVSRQRYWGAPLPIWRNPETKDIKVFGSLAELTEFVPKRGNHFFTMRHGESESNAADVVQTVFGAGNPLTEQGKKQIAAAIKELKEKDITKIITSPFERTMATAELVREGLGLSADMVVTDERIGEIQLGDLEGKPNSEYQAFVEAGAQWCDCAPEGGESWAAVRDRMGRFLYDIEAAYENENILIISHNSPLRMLAAVAHGSILAETDFDHDSDGMRFQNAEVRELAFTPMPHNDHFELDFHRPYIDDVVLEEDGVRLERIPDVFDCWFESGSMPYAETHYPFENLDVADMKNGVRFPADFIAESVDQTRGWFYSLTVLGVALFGRSPFENVITNGLVLAEDGKKMSKSLQNYPDPIELVERQGADSMRFYLLSSPIIKGEDLNFSEKEVAELQRKNIGRLHNVLAMYEMFADGTKASTDSTNVLDRWMIARVAEAAAEITAGFKNYELDKATRPITDLVDDLSVWYLRRSRDRLKGENLDDKQATLSTLRYTLQSVAQLMAPSMPFYAEYLWRAIRADDQSESVHLSAWPEVVGIDEEIVKTMHQVREVVTAALEARTKAGVKVRQPLGKLTIKTELASEYLSVIADELNVKEVTVDVGLSELVELDVTITPELQTEGDAREFMRAVQDMRKQAGLEASDRITLTVQASDGGEAIIEAFKIEIQKTVGADDILFDRTEGTEITAGEHSLTVSIEKQ